MKKFVAMILTLVLVLSMSITAFAADNNTQTVTGTYTASAETAETVYNIEIAWGSMEFTYEVPADIWNDQTHSYESGGKAQWKHDEGANVVTVTNRSNAAVNVAVTTDTGSSGITASVTNGSFTLGDASVGATTETPGAATSGSASITLSGELTDTTAVNKAIGSVTVKVQESGTDNDLILNHTPGNKIVYKWSEDHLNCTACYNCICVIGGTCDYLFEQETVTAVVSEVVTNGTLHTATFTNTTLGVAEKVVGYQYDKTTNTYSVWDEDGLNIWRLAVEADDATNLTLMDDITLSTDGITVDENDKPSGSNWTFVKRFQGTLDGGGHRIVNLRMYDELRAHFIFVVYGGTIKNLTFVNPVIYGESAYTATLAGQIMNGSSIIGCHVQGGSVTGEGTGTGGLIGTIVSEANYIYGCTNSAKVTGTIRVGGIVGISSDTANVFVACANTGEVSGNSYVGGIDGLPKTSEKLIACYTTVGNICGNTSATVTGSYYVASEDTDGEDGTTAVADVNTNDVVNAMNAAITTYNQSAETKVNYQWTVGDNGIPVLVEN